MTAPSYRTSPAQKVDVLHKKLSLNGTLCAKPTAEEKKWRADFRTCEIRRLFSIGDDEGQAFDVGGGQISVSIGPDDIREIEKGLAVLKKCNAFYQCVVDRDAGKVKHCYENDSRWR